MSPTSRRFLELYDPDWMRREYVERKRPYRDIADELGCSYAAVAKAVKWHGFQRRSRFPRLHDAEWMRWKYVDRKEAPEGIADELGCSRASVMNAVKRYGLQRPRNPRKSSLKVASLDAAWLREQYVDRWRSLHDIGAEVGLTGTTIASALRLHSIPVRPSGSRGPKRPRRNRPSFTLAELKAIDRALAGVVDPDALSARGKARRTLGGDNA